MTVAIILIVAFAVLLIAALVRVMWWPSRLGRWPSRPAAPGSPEHHRIRHPLRVGRRPQPPR